MKDGMANAAKGAEQKAVLKQKKWVLENVKIWLVFHEREELEGLTISVIRQ